MRMDSNKQNDQHVRVRDIKQTDSRTLSITWTDGKQSLYDVVELRRQCPCAHCVDEWTRKRLLKPEDVPQSVRPTVIESVGQYAISIHFSDGHKTGIYTFQRLRQLG
jgi:DUF971 family protein